MDDVVIRRVADPYGWLGNMSPHPVWYEGKRYRTAEALFQALRFESPTIRREIRQLRSPMAAKMRARRYAAEMAARPRSPCDVENMRLVLRLKLERHPKLAAALLATAGARIVEDCSRRNSESGRFWGAKWTGEVWDGTNTLGTLWMELRDALRTRPEASVQVSA